MNKTYIEPTQDAVIAMLNRQILGPVIMLNMLRFRKFADYTANPELAADTRISGREAYQRYIEHSHPFLTASGGSILMIADANHFLIGPAEEQWDMVMLIQQQSVDSFLAFASDQAYLSGIGHRTAALLDSRLLPISVAGEGTPC